VQVPRSLPLSQRAFTILEVVAAMLVIGILAALIVPNYDRLFAAAQQAKCISNMRSIRIALAGHLDDHQQVWPQGPPPGAPDWGKFWIDTLAPYGIGANAWECPTLRAQIKDKGKSAYSLHYAPTMFDATPNIANRWSTQPWLVEVANAHGHGALICFPDGSVKPLSKVLAEQGYP
jgi:prepilin-type N-terminal cleavage/methylation domain-containing protein